MFRRDEIVGRDEELLARLGYKQEFKRAFTPLEVCSRLHLLVRRSFISSMWIYIGVRVSVQCNWLVPVHDVR